MESLGLSTSALVVSKGPFELYFELEPIPKARPRMTRRGHAFTPEKTRIFEHQVALLAKQQYYMQPIEGPIACELAFFFASPKRPKCKSYPLGKVDLDNVCKALLDACNGILWKDDSQIVTIYAIKRFASSGKPPHIRMKFAEIK